MSEALIVTEPKCDRVPFSQRGKKFLWCRYCQRLARTARSGDAPCKGVTITLPRTPGDTP
jgi:hypothetical protein